jgi:predicted DNA-binding WGR domain protein
MKRYFEFVGEDLQRKSKSASKFWQVEVSGKKMSVTYGPIGAKGQSKDKSFASPKEATAEAEKLIGQKLKKGSVEK